MQSDESKGGEEKMAPAVRMVKRQQHFDVCGICNEEVVANSISALAWNMEIHKKAKHQGQSKE